MIGRRAVAGLSLLSALLLCAFAAQGAFAAEKPANGTAVTCVSEKGETKKDFADAHCDEQVTPETGKFEHLKIAPNIPTAVSATNKKVTPNAKGEKTTESEPAVLKGTLLGGKVTITCTEVENTTTENLEKGKEGKPLSYDENTEVEKKHRFNGTATTAFKTCTVTEVNNCKVAEPIETKASFAANEELENTKKIRIKGPKGEENPMALKFTGEGPEETFTEITFTGASCPLLNGGAPFPVKGNVFATSGPTTESKQDNKWAGSTLVFTPKFEMEDLKLGASAAEFSTILTPTMAETGGNPIAWTTF